MSQSANAAPALLSNQMRAIDNRFGPITYRTVASLTSYEQALRKHPERQLVKRLTRTGSVVRMVQHDGRHAAQRGTDPAMIKLLARSKALWTKLRTGETDIATLAREEQINDSYATRMVRLAFLSPDIVAAIMSGEQPASLNAASLLSTPIPTNWNEQARVFGLA